jgi:hypothetical protein
MTETKPTNGDAIPSTREATPNALTSAPDRWVSLYVAAKLRHAPMLVEVRKSWPKIRFSARWPLIATLESESNRPARHWQDDNLADMMTSEVVLIYAEPGDHLQNALFEAGIAWQMGKKIWLVSAKLTEDSFEHPDFKNLRGRPRVRLVSNFEKALEEIAKLAEYPSRGD